MDNKQQLLVITELLLPTKGGTAVWFDEVYRRIGGKGIHIVTADVEGAAEHDATHPNTIHRISFIRHWWLKPESLATYLKLLFKGLFITLRHRPAEVHAGRVLPEGLVGWIIARLSGIPITIYAHGEEITGWMEPMKHRAKCFTYRHADRLIANSDFTYNELLKIGVDKSRITLISPGVDIDRFRPDLKTDDLLNSIELSNDSNLILSVGRLSRRKGFDQLLQVVADLTAQGLKVDYALIGIGEDDAYLKQIAADLNILPHVHFLGHVSQEDLPRWYNACTLFAMPNREINGDTEGFGMVFIEAAACRKPVIAGIAGGTGSAVVNGETGLRVNGGSVEEITNAIKQLLTDKNGYKVMSDKAYTRATDEFSWDAIARKTIALSEKSRVK
jgi:phosphatidyl-myo-inositol dimannoside synthase